MKKRLSVPRTGVFAFGATLTVIVLAIVVFVLLPADGGTSARRGVVYQRGGWIYFTPLNGVEPLRVGTPRRLAQGVEPSVSPDGRLVLIKDSSSLLHFNYGGRPTAAPLYLISSDGGQPKVLSDTATDGFWSPDSRHIAVEASGKSGWSELLLVDARSGKVEKTIKAYEGAASFTPDSKFLVYVGFKPGYKKEVRGSEILVVDLQDGRIHRIADLSFDVLSTSESGLTLSPDSRRLAYIGESATREGRDLFVVDLRSGQTRRITHVGDVERVLWGPKQIALTQSNSDGIWVVSPAGGRMRLLGAPSEASSYSDGYPVRWLRDGQLLLTDSDLQLQLIDVVRAKTIATFDLSATGVTAGFTISFDGRLALTDTCGEDETSGSIEVAQLGSPERETPIAKGCNASWNN
jgi:hypothetical protein